MLGACTAEKAHHGDSKPFLGGWGQPLETASKAYTGPAALKTSHERPAPKRCVKDIGATSETALVTRVLTLLLNVPSSGWHREAIQPAEMTAEVNKHPFL